MGKESEVTAEGRQIDTIKSKAAMHHLEHRCDSEHYLIPMMRV